MPVSHPESSSTLIVNVRRPTLGSWYRCGQRVIPTCTYTHDAVQTAIVRKMATFVVHVCDVDVLWPVLTVISVHLINDVIYL